VNENSKSEGLPPANENSKSEGLPSSQRKTVVYADHNIVENPIGGPLGERPQTPGQNLTNGHSVDKQKTSGNNGDGGVGGAKKTHNSEKRWKTVVASVLLATFIIPAIIGIFVHYLWKRFGPSKKTSSSAGSGAGVENKETITFSQGRTAMGLFFREDIGAFVCSGRIKPSPHELGKVPDELKNRLFSKS
jgi:hypothetical protein